MTRADDRVTAALLEQAELPDLSGLSDQELFDGLAQVPARRAEAGVDGVAYIGELRHRRFTFEAIRDRSGIPVGTACRWRDLFRLYAKTQGEK